MNRSNLLDRQPIATAIGWLAIIVGLASLLLLLAQAGRKAVLGSERIA